MRNLLKNIITKINGILQRMAESNRKEFGSKKLDCCDLKKN